MKCLYGKSKYWIGLVKDIPIGREFELYSEWENRRDEIKEGKPGWWDTDMIDEDGVIEEWKPYVPRKFRKASNGLLMARRGGTDHWYSVGAYKYYAEREAIYTKGRRNA